MIMASYGPHYGEEDVLVGKNGSGTVFFSYCTLQCVFCQNYDISCSGEGYEVSPEHLALIMIHLQERGCHNINLVSPTHFVPQIVEALALAIPQGLIIPLVYGETQGRSFRNISSCLCYGKNVPVFHSGKKRTQETYRAGTNSKVSKAEKINPPAIDIAKGLNKRMPLKINGIKPSIVVVEVNTIGFSRL